MWFFFLGKHVMIPVVSLNICLCLLFVLFMKTPNVNAMSETESWICHPLCSGFLAYCAMDCCVDLLEKANKTLQFLHNSTLIIKGQEFSTVIPTVALRKSQPLKLRLVFYLLAERISMFSAKLKAFESSLLVCIFLRYQYVATVGFTSKGFTPNRRLQDTDEFIAVRSSPLFLASFWLCPW